jgi:hypothetical protein
MGEFLLLFVNTLFIHLYLKSTHISPLGYGLHEFSLGFNAVANVYPREVIKSLATYLEDYFTHSYENFKNLEFFEITPKDLLLKKFKTKYNLKEFILEPSVFQHVGLQSSLSYTEFDSTEIYKQQYKPFQSYSYLKEYAKERRDEIKFDPNEWSLP